MTHAAVPIILAFIFGYLLGRWRPFGGPDAVPPVPLVRFGREPLPKPTDDVGSYPREVWLLDSGENKVKTIKTIRSFTHLDLRDAMVICDRAPGPLCRVVSAEEAAIVGRMFQGIASVEIR